MFDDLFNHRKLNTYKLQDYGFVRRECDDAGCGWEYETDVMAGEFHLLVHIDGQGRVDTDLVEAETGDEYELYKTGAVGSFVGDVREAVRQVLIDIEEKCFDPAVFHASQASLLIEHAQKNYGSQLEFLWPKFPENAVVRRHDNRKWYGIFMTISGRKIGLDSDDKVELIDFRMAKDEKGDLLAHAGYYPGWHMNKDSWFTVVLDGEVSDSELVRRMDESFDLAGK